MKKIEISKRYDKQLMYQYILIMIFLIILSIFINCRMDNLLDSDIASQLVLSKHLSEKGVFLSTDWYYATEIRVLGLQLIYTPLFHITSNWHTVRVVGNIIMYIILLISLYYLCNQINIKNYFPILGILFLLPFSKQYLLYSLININYIPYLTFSFFAIGMCFHFCNVKSMIKKIVIIIIAGVLALLTGMNGIRQIYITYAPMFITSLFLLFINNKYIFKENLKDINENEYIKFVIINFWSIFMSVIGYIVNIIYLSKLYYYESQDGIVWKPLSLHDISKVLNGWIECLGYKNGEKLFSKDILHNAVCFMTVCILVIVFKKIIRNYKKSSFESLAIACFIICGGLLSVFLFCFTSQTYQERYDLPIIIFNFLLLVLYIAQEQITVKYRNLIIILMIVGTLLSSIGNYMDCYTIDKTDELRKIGNVLEDSGYLNGYATFWNANVLTELTDGNITVWSWCDLSIDVQSIDQVYKWAQVKEHSTTYPKGKVFCIIGNKEKNKITFSQNLSEEYLIYSSSEYSVFGFENYDQMSIIAGYNMSFNDNFYLLNGSDINGVRHINKDGVSFGPYITLLPGKYLVQCTGEKLDNAAFDSVYKKTGAIDVDFIDMKNIQHDSQSICYEIEIQEKIDDYEARFFNNTNEEILIDSLVIKKIE